MAKEISKAAFSKTLAAKIGKNHLSLKLETREMKKISASSVGKKKQKHEWSCRINFLTCRSTMVENQEVMGLNLAGCGYFTLLFPVMGLMVFLENDFLTVQIKTSQA